MTRMGLDRYPETNGVQVRLVDKLLATYGFLSDKSKVGRYAH